MKEMGFVALFCFVPDGGLCVISTIILDKKNDSYVQRRSTPYPHNKQTLIIFDAGEKHEKLAGAQIKENSVLCQKLWGL